MLERRTALAGATPYASPQLRIEEAPEFTLTQAAGLSPDFETRLAKIIGTLPDRVGIAIANSGRTVLRIGPSQIWIIAPQADDYSALGAVTPLSSSRTRILIEGGPARDVLAKGIPLDFHPAVFASGSFAMTGLHHTPVLVHCIGDNAFHLYAMRTFAMSVWEWLTDAALEFC